MLILFKYARMVRMRQIILCIYKQYNTYNKKKRTSTFSKYVRCWNIEVKQTMRNLLCHDCKVTALPEGAESWFTGLDSILPVEAKSREYEMKEYI